MTLPSGIGHSVTQRRPHSTSVMVNEPPRLPRCLAQPRVVGRLRLLVQYRVGAHPGEAMPDQGEDVHVGSVRPDQGGNVA